MGGSAGKMSWPSVQLCFDHTSIVTGADSGLGFETAKHLAFMGSRVILACRNEVLATAAMMKIKADYMVFMEMEDGEKEWDYPQLTELKLEYINLNLASFDSVIEFCKKFQQTGFPLHILVCNAGVVMVPYSKTQDNHECHLQVNYLSHFLLTTTILPIMKCQSSQSNARIVFVSCPQYDNGHLDLLNMEGLKKYDRKQFYANSKLYLVMFMFSLNRRLKPEDKINVFCADPGNVETNAIKNFKDDKSLLRMYKIAKKTGSLKRDIIAGAATIINAAINPFLNDMSGAYFSKCLPATASVASKNEKIQDVLMKFSTDTVEKWMTEEAITEFKPILS